MPNWLDNESAARGTQDALKILVARSAVILMSILPGNEFLSLVNSKYRDDSQFTVIRKDVGACVDCVSVIIITTTTVIIGTIIT